ncbi:MULTISPECIES: nuclear transport factor 2 family protein [unclassified Mycolicibacterium]|uniref:nuclear transport factor 2 family protein n=1 Tax=unclassified Mycolicibacterium TaxID=2636767 RepID=UPI002EDA58FD
MTAFAAHRDTVRTFVDSMHGGADENALAAIFADDVIMYSPLGDEPITGRAAVLEAIRAVGTVANDLTYGEVLSGQRHHAVLFGLRIEDTVVNGMDHILVDADGKIAELTIWWRPLPAGVQMQRRLAALFGTQPWELTTPPPVTSSRSADPGQCTKCTTEQDNS